jgi:hypothetical protein
MKLSSVLNQWAQCYSAETSDALNTLTDRGCTESLKNYAVRAVVLPYSFDEVNELASGLRHFIWKKIYIAMPHNLSAGDFIAINDQRFRLAGQSDYPSAGYTVFKAYASENRTLEKEIL